MPIYNSQSEESLTNVTVQFASSSTPLGQASKAEISIEHGVNENETFDGILLSAKSLPGGNVSLTRLTRHNQTTEKAFLDSLSKLVPQEGYFDESQTDRTLTITDNRGEPYVYTLYNCYIDKFQSTYEGEEVPEFNVDIKSEKITVYSGGSSAADKIDQTLSTISPGYSLAKTVYNNYTS